eukprot:6178924-Pleurochrysis_carterae.AAC.1
MFTAAAARLVRHVYCVYSLEPHAYFLAAAIRLRSKLYVIPPLKHIRVATVVAHVSAQPMGTVMRKS